MEKLKEILVLLLVFHSHATSGCFLDGYGICIFLWREAPREFKTLAEAVTHDDLLHNSSTPIHWTENKRTPICQQLEGKNVEKMEILTKTTDAITRLLNFVVTHFEEVHDANMAIAIGMLKVYDDQNSGYFEERFQLSKIMVSFCDEMILRNESGLTHKFCHNLIKDWARVRGTNIPSQVLGNAANALNLADIGNEKEKITSTMNHHCQSQLLDHCTMNSECTKMFFAKEPSTQYMLSHQLLQRMLASMLDCQSLKELKDSRIEDSLCAKMLMESQFISHAGYPDSVQDLLVENVGFCGFKGYQNMFRLDWLQQILTWQSKSEYGCFLEPKEAGPLRSDSTQSEEESSVKAKETCNKHFTAVGLMALSGFWDHIRSCL